MIHTTSAMVFTFLTVIVILFQLGLVAGLPWGSASMGGRFPGKHPPKMRIIALINILVLCFINVTVLSRASLLFEYLMPFSRIAIWVIVVFFGIGTILNTITRSKIERIWAPVAGIQFITSVVIATG